MSEMAFRSREEQDRQILYARIAELEEQVRRLREALEKWKCPKCCRGLAPAQFAGIEGRRAARKPALAGLCCQSQPGRWPSISTGAQEEL